MRNVATQSLFLLALTALTGCDSAKQDTPQPAQQSAQPEASRTVAPPPAGSGGFQPLQSDQVKDAMHRALRSGETQRWQDGAFSGYAVPGPTGANGCRAIRYTVDQRPEVPFESITACEANRPAAPK